MIGHLKGQIIHKNPPEILLQTGGVGYEVVLPLTCFGDIDETKNDVQIYIHTLVREDALQLYGFTSLNQRTLFRELIKVNGIGAKMGITILSSMSVEEFYHCVHTKDNLALTKLPGVGKKTAERLLLDMYDRLQNLNHHANLSPSNQSAHQKEPNTTQQAVSALVSLGYKSHEAEKLLQSLVHKDLSVSELIREALKIAR